MKFVRPSALVLIALISTSAGAQQGPGRPTAGIFGGITTPNGDFKDEAGNGWHAGALVKMRAYGVLDVRLDGSYHKFAKKDLEGTIATLTTDANMIIGTLNALVNLGPDSASYPGDNSISPHLVLGPGIYKLDYKAICTGTCTDFNPPTNDNHFGFNIGGGATIPLMGLRPFVEARYHRMMRDNDEGGTRSFMTLSAGIKIR